MTGVQTCALPIVSQSRYGIFLLFAPSIIFFKSSSPTTPPKSALDGSNSTFFGFGLLLAFTPCVFPMIPILSSIIVKASQNENMSAKKGFLMSFVYVLAMSFAYSLAGIIAGIFGANLQASLQTR